MMYEALLNHETANKSIYDNQNADQKLSENVCDTGAIKYFVYYELKYKSETLKGSKKFRASSNVVLPGSTQKSMS